MTLNQEVYVSFSNLEKEHNQLYLTLLALSKTCYSRDYSEVFFPNQKAVNDGLATKITRPTSTDKAIPRFSGSSGELQDSGVTIDDSGNITPTGIFLVGVSATNLLDDY